MRSQELLDLDEALERLVMQLARKSQIVELRFFGGLTVKKRLNSETVSANGGARMDGGEGVALSGAERGRNLMKPERWKKKGHRSFPVSPRTRTRGARRIS